VALARHAIHDHGVSRIGLRCRGARVDEENIRKIRRGDSSDGSSFTSPPPTQSAPHQCPDTVDRAAPVTGKSTRSVDAGGVIPIG